MIYTRAGQNIHTRPKTIQTGKPMAIWVGIYGVTCWCFMFFGCMRFTTVGFGLQIWIRRYPTTDCLYCQEW